MPTIDQAWFTYFHADPGKPRGTRDRATIQTTTGAEIMRVEPGINGVRHREEEKGLRNSFEDNVRMAGAARDLYKSLKDVVALAIEAGVPYNARLIVEAEAAMEKARPRKYDVSHDGAVKFRGTHDECFGYIMRSQGQSVDYATKYGGWLIAPAGLELVQPQDSDPDDAPAPSSRF